MVSSYGYARQHGEYSEPLPNELYGSMAAGGGWYALAGLLMKPVHRDPRTMMNMAIVPARGS